MKRTMKDLLAVVFFGVCSLAHATTDLSAQDYDFYPGDFNGDGKTDLLYVAKSADKISGIAISDGAGPNSSYQTWASNYLGIAWSGNQYSPLVADFNGDSKADVFLQRNTAGDSYLLLATAQGLLVSISQTVSNTALGLTWSGDQHKLLAGDFNYDGKADLFFQATSTTGTHAVVYAGSNGQFTSGPTQTWSDGALGLNWSASKAIVYVGDFNGDHKADLLVQAKPKFVMIDYEVPFPVPTYAANMNGVALSQGGATPFQLSGVQTWSRMNNGVDWSPLTNGAVIGDFNGDGRDDVILQAKYTGKTSYLLTGNASGSIFPASATAMASNVNWSADAVRLIAGNFDGTAGTGLYLQALTAAGTNAYANTVTGASVTTTAQSSSQVTGTLPATSAGRTAGSFNVSPTGAATYQIPIWVPPGPNGIQPNLALTYNSQGGDSMLGPGWNLSGLSIIARCSQTVAQDGFTGGVALTLADKFCINGNRLRLTSAAGTYGAAGSTYQTEMADFSNITAYGQTGYGPTYFKVQGKDGLTYEYGNSIDSRITPSASVATPYQWRLNKVSDRAGNNYVVTYGVGATGSAGIGVPTSISYTPSGAGSATYNYTVTFNYMTRFNLNANTTVTSLTSYVAGTKIDNTNLLRSISVSSGGTLVHQYTLAYGTGGASSRARLTGVSECAGSTGTDCLSPTTITYHGEAVGVISASNATSVSSNVWVLAARDFDGDSRDDILYRLYSTGALYVIFSGATSTICPSGGCNVGATYSGGYSYTGNPLSLMVGDVVGSGKNDIVMLNAGVWWRYYWNGTSFVGVPTTTSENGVGTTFFGGLADINGDGLPDLVTAPNWGGPTSILTRLNTTVPGSNTLSFSATTNLAYNFGSNCQIYYRCFTYVTVDPGMQNGSHVMDFNGDGKQDVFIDSSYWYWDGWSWILMEYVDVALLSNGTGFTGVVLGRTSVQGSYAEPGIANINKDNCTDVTSVGYVYTSKCDGTFSKGAALSFAQSTAIGKFDWNGDGLSDFIGTSSASGTYTLALSNSAGTPTMLTTSIPFGYPNNFFVFDQNGDGQTDFGVYGATGISYYLHDSIGSPPDMVASITDGYGVTVRPVFLSTANSSVYSAGAAVTAPEQAATDPFYVVSQVTTTDGAGGVYTQNYTYSGAVEDMQGRGLAGFQTRTVTDSRANTPVVKTYYKAAFPYTGMVYQQDVCQHSDVLCQNVSGTTLISRTVNTPSTLAASTLDATANNQRYFPYVASTSTDSYEVGGSKNGALIAQSSATLAYDGYGNLTSSTSTTTDKDGTAPISPTYGKSWTTAITNTISPNPTNWCLGIPTKTQVAYSTTVTNELAVTRTADFTPDYIKCRITQKIVEPNSSSHKVQIDYGYDSFGNVSSQTVTGINMTARTTTTSWGTTGQFPISTTNALGQTSTAGYDYNLGVQASVTDPNGLSTSLSYDNFGRKTRETKPDGTYTAYSYNNCSSVGCLNGDPTSGSTNTNRMVVIATSTGVGGGTLRDDWTYLDQFDRTIVTKSKTLSGYTRVGTQYDALGNAYRQTAPCDAASCVAYWTTNTYDALNRVTASSRPISATNLAPQATTIAYQGLTTVITDPQSKQSTKAADPNGWLRQSKDHNGYYQAFGYDAFGSLKTVTDSLSNNLFSANYVYGAGAFQTGTTDMDLGTWGYTPNALGEVVAYTDANTNIINMEYDALSRPVTQSVSGETTRRWLWGTSAAAHEIGQLKAVCVDSSATCTGTINKEIYTYDSIGRLSQKDITSDGTTYSYNYAYSATTGLLDTLTYPVSTASYRLKLQYLYQSGMLQQVKDYNAGTVFWQVNSMNPRGEITQEILGNGIVTNRSFDAVTGWLNSIQSGVGGGTGAQNESYLFDKVGNVTQRQNNAQGLTENFYYDDLHRLNYSQLGSTTNLDMTYDSMGNILNRTDVASNAAWTYHSTKKHEVLQAGSSAFTYTYDNNGNAITRNGQSITWNKYNYPTVINSSATENVALSYNANNQRWKQVYVNGSTTETTYYIGGLMEKVVAGSSTDYRHYIYSQDNAAAVAVMSCSTTSGCTNSGPNTTSYILDDHQQSPSSIRDRNGNLVVNESFTAYGKRRGWNTWTGNPTSTELTTSANVTQQGYTWQTALGNMGLNHMNGRVQDAITGRFLSADPYITEPGNTQNYNRYSYVYNNPLSLTDPSGFQVDQTCAAATFYLYGIAAKWCDRSSLEEVVITAKCNWWNLLCWGSSTSSVFANSTFGTMTGTSDGLSYYSYSINQGSTGSRTATPQTKAWPVPGHCTLNQADASRGQGSGKFGSSRSGGRTHEGIDIAAPTGSRVVAALSGTVVNIAPNPSGSYGYQVVIDVGGNNYLQYAHLGTPQSVMFGGIMPGMNVSAGQQIGNVGRTGNVPALADSHLHLEYRNGGPGPFAAVSDPLTVLPSCMTN